MSKTLSMMLGYHTAEVKISISLQICVHNFEELTKL